MACRQEMAWCGLGRLSVVSGGEGGRRRSPPPSALQGHFYGFHKTAGSDNHVAGAAKRLAGMISSEPIKDEADFIRHVLADDMELFLEENDAE